MDSGFDLLAVLLALAAFFGYLNHRVLRLPLTVGLLVCALAGTLVLVGLDAALPQLGLKTALRAFLESLNFPETLLDGILAFLLFAAALEVDSSGLLNRKWTILVLATVGTVISTVLIAGALLVLSTLMGLGHSPYLVPSVRRSNLSNRPRGGASGSEARRRPASSGVDHCR